MASIGGEMVMDCVGLRVTDIDFEHGEIVIRHGKGGKNRRAMLLRSLRHPLQAQLAEALRIQERDKSAGFGRVWMPDALARKYPAASLDGSMFFRRRSVRLIRVTASNAGIIWMNRHCSAR